MAREPGRDRGRRRPRPQQRPQPDRRLRRADQGAQRPARQGPHVRGPDPDGRAGRRRNGAAHPALHPAPARRDDVPADSRRVPGPGRGGPDPADPGGPGPRHPDRAIGRSGSVCERQRRRATPGPLEPHLQRHRRNAGRRDAALRRSGIGRSRADLRSGHRHRHAALDHGRAMEPFFTTKARTAPGSASRRCSAS